MKMMWIPALLAGLTMLVAGCGEKVKPGTSEVGRQRITGVAAARIEPAEVDEFYDTSGTVAAKTVSSVASRVMGMVTAVYVTEGDTVAAGQVLLTVDDSDVRQRVAGAAEGRRGAEKAVEMARQGRDLADITYERYKKLYDDKALTGQELDAMATKKRVAELELERANAGLKQAEAGLKEAEVYSSFTRVVSPVAGVVTEKKIEKGSMASPGVPLITVEDTSGFRVDISADERTGGKLRKGMEARVFIDSLQKEMKGKITEVVPSVDPASRSVLVKIAVAGEGLKNGQYAKVSIPTGRKTALLVPARAVVEKGELTGVYTVGAGSVVSYRLVRIGRAYGNDVEVLSGLSPHETVITDGMQNAVDGGVLSGPQSGKGN